MEHLFNVKERTDLRRKLRNDGSPIERRLWWLLSGSKIEGTKFRRQYGIGPYVVDFYATDVRLAVEVDGHSHSGDRAFKRDLDREQYLRRWGVTIIRFSNQDVVHHTVEVAESIAAAVRELRHDRDAGFPRRRETTPSPSLEQEGRR